MQKKKSLNSRVGYIPNFPQMCAGSLKEAMASKSDINTAMMFIIHLLTHGLSVMSTALLTYICTHLWSRVLTFLRRLPVVTDVCVLVRWAGEHSLLSLTNNTEHKAAAQQAQQLCSVTIVCRKKGGHLLSKRNKTQVSCCDTIPVFNMGQRCVCGSGDHDWTSL